MRARRARTEAVHETRPRARGDERRAGAVRIRDERALMLERRGQREF